MSETITITIDGETIETTPGTSVLAAALAAGICIPNLCLLPGAPPIGACRVCLVEVERHGRTRMTASCTLDAQDGMVIHAHSENVLRARRNIVELLLAEAPQSPVLQSLAERLEIEIVRYPEREADCILCGRCVAACAVVAGTGAKGFIGRGNHRHIGLPFYDQKYCQKCDKCKERCPLEIAPVSKRGKPGGVCGSELSVNEEIPEICENCMLE
ncbi:MAG: 2Fe-2S iron-sulfur cluster-binding protein [Thermoguttaceae bacterium]|jgi:NADH dehydrogenase/NADH:ubiquinone oxidoreductase subunit G